MSCRAERHAGANGDNTQIRLICDVYLLWFHSNFKISQLCEAAKWISVMCLGLAGDDGRFCGAPGRSSETSNDTEVVGI